MEYAADENAAYVALDERNIEYLKERGVKRRPPLASIHRYRSNVGWSRKRWSARQFSQPMPRPCDLARDNCWDAPR